MVIESASAGDELPPNCAIIEVRVTELRQLFNAIDPSPFHERDLDPNAEEFITGWASEIAGSAPFGLLVYVGSPPGATNEAEILREAVQLHFRRKADGTRRRLRALLRRGRISLIIGLGFLGASGWLANALAGAPGGGGFRGLLHESLIIGGWVAMWRPMEVFLYDWWPIRAEAKRLDRLAMMPVRIQYMPEGTPGAGRRDWPAAAARTQTPAVGRE